MFCTPAPHHPSRPNHHSMPPNPSLGKAARSLVRRSAVRPRTAPPSTVTRAVRYSSSSQAGRTRGVPASRLGAAWVGGAVLGALATTYVVSSAREHPSTTTTTTTTTTTKSKQILEPHWPGALAALRSHLKDDQISLLQSELDAHISGWSYEHSYAHSAVVWPESTADVVAIVKVCNEHNIPLTPFAGGTSVESQTSAPNPSEDPRPNLCVDMGRMSAIVELNPQDGDVTVQAGLGWEALNKQLKPHGLFFPMDPGPTARIGGMAATGCSGTNAVHFGTMRGDYVLALEVVLPTGEVVHTRTRARKSSAGPDLTKLFVGSEGILGIITQATLRLAPLRPNAVAVASFESVDQACAAAHAILARGIAPQCLEMIDTPFASAINRAMEADPTETRRLPVRPSLFIKFVGASAEHLAADWTTSQPILQRMGGTDLKFVDRATDMEGLWSMRKLALMYVQQYPHSPYPEGNDDLDDSDQEDDKGKWRFIGTDQCVPLSQLPALVRKMKEACAEQQIYAPILGHVGDGNVHAGLMWRESDTAKEKRVHQLLKDMALMAQALGGTCTGEHGVGLGKRQFLVGELGHGTVGLLRAIKEDVLDPNNIMNPGKLLPPRD